jgi:hypothetical protein
VKGTKIKAKEDVEPVRTTSGGYINNHNETTVSDDEAAGEAQLADLPVADEQAYETKGGPAARWEQVIIGDLPPAH